jgi:nicotinate phosphoribosyltransferase
MPAMKLSRGKTTLPGKKQIFRQLDANSMYCKDVIGLENENVEGKPLLIRVMNRGHSLVDKSNLCRIRENALINLRCLPDQYKKLRGAPAYPVQLSPALKEVREQLAQQLKSSESAS